MLLIWTGASVCLSRALATKTLGSCARRYQQLWKQFAGGSKYLPMSRLRDFVRELGHPLGFNPETYVVWLLLCCRVVVQKTYS